MQNVKDYDRCYIVHKAQNNQWMWTAYSTARSRKVLATTGETHHSRAYTVKAAIKEAHGRPVFLQHPKTKLNTQIQ